MPAAPRRVVGRRTVLRTSGRVLAAGAVLATAGGAAAACTVGQEPAEPDPFEALASSANDDAAAAQRLAAADPSRAPALQAVADERRAHARALTGEIMRKAGVTATPTADDSAPAAPAGPGTSVAAPAPPPPPPTLDDLRAALAASQRAAADTARTLSGHRAGLAGSIAAACAAAQKVLIA